MVAPPRTRLVTYLRLGLGDLLVQLLSFLSRLVAVREYTLSGQFYASVISDERRQSAIADMPPPRVRNLVAPPGELC